MWNYVYKKRTWNQSHIINFVLKKTELAIIPSWDIIMLQFILNYLLTLKDINQNITLNVGLASGQPYLSYDVFEYSSNIGHILNDVTLFILFQESWFSLKLRINRFTSRACSTTLTKWVLNLYRSSINDVTQFLMKTSSALHYF